MCKILVEKKLDGKIQVKNQNKGACFIITLKP